MIKTTLREIRSSLGRYLAIFAIVALGVGFFGGLKCTKPAMIKTLDSYLAAQEFFDYRLLSTIGFDKDSVDAVKNSGIEGIKSVEGAYYIDALCTIKDESESPYRIHSITKDINKLYLVSGKLPDKPSECVVDNYMSDVNIGDKLIITQNNDEDTLELLKHHEYTVTGVVRSPYYINFERGTTSIGTGKLSGFLYIPEEAFGADYYTEIFVRTDNEGGAYTQEYDDYISLHKDEISDLAMSLVAARYDRIVNDANEQIVKAKEDLDKESKEAKEDLDEAFDKLVDGKKEINESSAKISDGEKEIESARKALKSKESQIVASYVEIDQKTKELENAYLYNLISKEEFEYSKSILEQNRALVDEGAKAIAQGKRTLDDKEAELTEAKEQIDKATQELSDGMQEYKDGLSEYNDSIKDANDEINEAQKELDDMEEPSTYCLLRDTNIGYACYDSDTNIVASVANVFPLFFFLVAVLICMTTMNRMVEEQRTQIGIFKALGYSSFTIMGKYVFYAGSSALLGAVLGYIGGTILLPQAIWQGYNIMYNMGSTIEYKSVPIIAVLSILTAILCATLAAYFSVIYELKDVPANLIRPKAPKSGKRVIFEYITPLWNRLKFLHKVSIRNIFRYKKRFFMMVIGIGGCTALLLTAFGIGDSIKGIADRQYTTIQVYDLSATFSDDFNKSDKEIISGINGVSQIAFTKEEAKDLIYNGKTKSVTTVIPENATEFLKFLSLHTQKNEPIEYPTGECGVISARAAEDMGISIGDTVKLQDADLIDTYVTISGICENYVYSYIYLPADSSKDYNTAWINATEPDDVHTLGAAVADNDFVMNVSVTSDLRQRIDTMMTGMNFIVLVVVLCAGALAFIVLYNLTNINITERKREIATIKVLGFFPSESSSYVFRENFVLTAIGALLGLPLGKALHAFIMYTIRIDMVSFKTYIAPVSYAYAILLTFGFALFVNFVMHYKINRINMAESLKSVE